MEEKFLLDVCAWILIISSPIVHLLLIGGIKAPYGRYQSDSFGAKIDAKTAWFFQELPAFAIPLIYILTADERFTLTSKVLLGAFMSHYFNRTFIYPFLIVGGKPTPIVIFLMAMFFCVANGHMQASYLIQYANYTNEWMWQWNFILGLCIFLFGMRTNIKCDSILRNLRAPGETGYKIPHGDMYEYVSAANLWGEAVEWTGWAIACWSLQAFAFAFFACLYLSGRSYSHHTWYQSKFEDYPKDRKIFIPFLL